MVSKITNPAPHKGPATQVGVGLGWLFGPAFLVLAGVLWMTSDGVETPSAPTPVFDKSELRAAPRRTILGDPPTTVIAGFEQRCNACHKLFQSNSNGKRALVQHLNISLEHGINNQCDNCHSREERERLVLHDGTTVPFTETEMLCAQCHGLVFRDWERSTHGKTFGAWDLSSPNARKLTCTECHDPHSPAYPLFKPLPGPNTLRMGEPIIPGTVTHEKERNPLRRWLPQEHEEDEEGEH